MRLKWIKGVSLLEVLVGLFILTAGTIAIIGMVIQGLQGVEKGYQVTVAKNFAVEMLEKLRLKGYEAIKSQAWERVPSAFELEYQIEVIEDMPVDNVKTVTIKVRRRGKTQLLAELTTAMSK
jgi:Tfp pilus assembly protein PilV